MSMRFCASTPIESLRKPGSRSRPRCAGSPARTLRRGGWAITVAHDFDTTRPQGIHRMGSDPRASRPAQVSSARSEPRRSHRSTAGDPMEKRSTPSTTLRFVTPVALVKPSKAVREVERLRAEEMKDKAFARAVSRDMMLKGAEDRACRSTTSSPRSCARWTMPPTAGPRGHTTT